MLKIFDLAACAPAPMENGRGETIRLINTGTGTEKIDLHLNRLVPGGPRGRCIGIRNPITSISCAAAKER